MFLEYLIETGIEIHLNLNLCVWQGRDFLNTNSINAMVIVLFWSSSSCKTHFVSSIFLAIYPCLQSAILL